MTTDDTFPQAVASFDPTSDAVLLWTRLGGGTTDAAWELARDPAFEDVVATGRASTDSSRDHTIVVDVDELEPATSYWYRFRTERSTSPVGRTRTLPDAGAERFLLATVCCARFSVAPLGVYRALAEREVDLVLHLGDYVYEDDGSKGPRPHEPDHTATTLDDYRRRIEQVRSDPDAQALHLRHPMTTIWDDHDLSDNAWRDGAKKHDPEEHGSWEARAGAAATARQEWLPARLRDEADPLVTWRSLVVGDLAELLLLDTRFIGRDRQAGDEESCDLDDPDRSLLGDAQRAWLHERVRDASRPWALVASGVVVNELELPWPRPLRWVDQLLPNGYAVIDGRVLHDDQWDGYPVERDRLVEALADRGRAGARALLLSGDVHSSWAFTGPVDPATQTAVAVEATTPAVSSAAMGRAHYPGLWRILDREANRLPHVGWAEVTERGYCTLDLRRDSATVAWWFADPYADDPAGSVKPGAAFRTEHAPWPPRFERVRQVADDPERPGLPAALPDRPDDLRQLRTRRRLRIVAESAGVAAATAGALAAGWRRARR